MKDGSLEADIKEFVVVFHPSSFFSPLHDKSATWFSCTIYGWNVYPELTGILNWFNLALVFFWLDIRFHNLILFVFVLFYLLIFVLIVSILSLFLQLCGWCFVICHRFSEPLGYYCCKYISPIFSHCGFSVMHSVSFSHFRCFILSFLVLFGLCLYFKLGGICWQNFSITLLSHLLPYVLYLYFYPFHFFKKFSTLL